MNAILDITSMERIATLAALTAIYAKQKRVAINVTAQQLLLIMAPINTASNAKTMNLSLTKYACNARLDAADALH